MALAGMTRVAPDYPHFSSNPRPDKVHRFTGGMKASENNAPPKFGIPSNHVTHDGTRTVYEVQSALATLAAAKIDGVALKASGVTPSDLTFAPDDQEKAATAERLLMFICNCSQITSYFNLNRAPYSSKTAGVPACLPMVSLSMINKKLRSLGGSHSITIAEANKLFTLRGPNINVMKSGTGGFSGGMPGTTRRLMVNSYVGGLQRHADCFVRSCADVAPFAGCGLYLVWILIDAAGGTTSYPLLVPILDVGSEYKTHFGRAHPVPSPTETNVGLLDKIREKWQTFKQSDWKNDEKCTLMCRVGQTTEYGTMPSNSYEHKCLNALFDDNEAAAANAVGVQT
jgi:hypothetical protein